ncbi:MAG: hypothetical protein WAP47_08855 [Candidatus Rokuibacteriota bacterium]
MSLDDVKFAGTGGWGAGLGRPLTRAEADGNLYALLLAIQALIDDPTPGVGIANITVTGRQFTVYLTDSSTLGPFDLPIASPRFRGVWVAAINYTTFDIVRVGGFGTYMVLQDHTSASVFDPYVSNSAGNYYVQIGPDPFYTPQALDVVDGALTLALIHQNKFIRALNAGGLYVDLDAGIFPRNAEIQFRQASSGAITVTAGSGVTINLPYGVSSASTADLGQGFKLKRVADAFGEQWDFIPISASGGGGGGGDGVGGASTEPFGNIFGPTTWSPIVGGLLYNCYGGVDVTLPETFTDLAQITLRQADGSPVTFAAESGATIFARDGRDLATAVQGDVVYIKYSASDVAWYVWGDLAPTGP